MVAAIETSYDGCRFRSRLEARWAVFLNEAQIEWKYEPRWIHDRVAGVRMNWLPDFQLDDGRFAEVKGVLDDADAARLITLAYLVGGCGRGQDVVILGHLPPTDSDLWPLVLHRHDSDVWASPWQRDPGHCPVKCGCPRLPSHEIDADTLLSGLSLGQPRWGYGPLRTAHRARFG